MNLFTKLALILRDRKFRFPSLPSKPPMLRISLGSQSTSKAIVFSIALATIVVGTGIFFAVKDVASSHWDWPDAGAQYNLPQKMGTKLPKYEDGTESHTLQINLADGVRLDRLWLKNLDLGKSGLAESFTINRTSGVTGAMVNIGNFIITNSSAPTLDWANMEVGSISLGAYVDGHTNAIQIDSTISQLIIDSDRGAGTYIAENSVVDRIVISTNGDTGAYIGEVIVDGVTSSVGSWNFDYLRIGVLTLDSSNRFGDGSGINSASAVFNSSIKSRSITDSLVDTPLKIQ
jgi:hypothetical protein